MTKHNTPCNQLAVKALHNSKPSTFPCTRAHFSSLLEGLVCEYFVTLVSKGGSLLYRVYSHNCDRRSKSCSAIFSGLTVYADFRPLTSCVTPPRFASYQGLFTWIFRLLKNVIFLPHKHLLDRPGYTATWLHRCWL